MSDEVEGIEKLIAKLQQLGSEGDDALGDGLLAGAHIYEGLVKISMTTAKHGLTYRRGKKSHVASAPGEAPAVDYGLVLNSISVEREGNDALITTSANISPHLEFGTARMQARPFMRPPMTEHRGKILTAVGKTLERKIEEMAQK